MRELSLLFKALSEPLRIRIIHLLLDNGREAYGEELARALEIPAYQLSRHLKVLKASGLINERRVGRWVYYSLANRNGQLLRTLRRLIAGANLPATHGNGRQEPRASKRRRRALQRSQQTLIEQDDFNWNQGPAIPGVL